MQQATGSAPKRSDRVDAIAILTNDHANVRKLFQQYESLKESGSTEEKVALAAMIAAELTAHAEAEEDIFYPAVRDAIDDEDVLDEAQVEHASARDLIEQLGDMEGDDPLYDATVKVLSEYVQHHVEEEEGQMFPKAREADLDLVALGAEIEARKEEILAEMVADQGEA